MQFLQVSFRPPMPHKRALPGTPGPKKVTNSGKGAHCEVATDEVDVVLHHVSSESLQKRGRCITFLGNFVVNVDLAEMFLWETDTHRHTDTDTHTDKHNTHNTHNTHNKPHTTLNTHNTGTDTGTQTQAHRHTQTQTHRHTDTHTARNCAVTRSTVGCVISRVHLTRVCTADVSVALRMPQKGTLASLSFRVCRRRRGLRLSFSRLRGTVCGVLLFQCGVRGEPGGLFPVRFGVHNDFHMETCDGASHTYR